MLSQACRGSGPACVRESPHSSFQFPVFLTFYRSTLTALRHIPHFGETSTQGGGRNASWLDGQRGDELFFCPCFEDQLDIRHLVDVTPFQSSDTDTFRQIFQESDQAGHTLHTRSARRRGGCRQACDRRRSCVLGLGSLAVRLRVKVDGIQAPFRVALFPCTHPNHHDVVKSRMLAGLHLVLARLERVFFVD